MELIGSLELACEMISQYNSSSRLSQFLALGIIQDLDMLVIDSELANSRDHKCFFFRGGKFELKGNLGTKYGSR